MSDNNNPDIPVITDAPEPKRAGVAGFLGRSGNAIILTVVAVVAALATFFALVLLSGCGGVGQATPVPADQLKADGYTQVIELGPNTLSAMPVSGGGVFPSGGNATKYVNDVVAGYSGTYPLSADKAEIVMRFTDAGMQYKNEITSYLETQGDVRWVGNDLVLDEPMPSSGDPSTSINGL